ncbi:Shedu immune nuclease family protein [Dactylosporangium sp. CA-233914]|uniref:Shedu immune nuclease family protein n=1 Tax=Dactylosporangium sp. CA-233914 TaxID=3239934 RepID=UPI003D909772
MNLDSYTMDWLDGQTRAPSRDDPDRHDKFDPYREAMQRVTEVFLALGKAGRIDLAEQVLRDERRRFGGTERMSYAQLAAATAVLAGDAGIRMLAEVALDDSYKNWANYGIEALWLAASNKRLPAEGYASSASEVHFEIPSAIRAKARATLDELIVNSKEDKALFAKILTLASLEANKNQVVGGVNDFTEHVMKVLAAGSIAVPASILDDFEALVSKNLPEERYQEFLKTHPTVLDPLAAEVIPKHRLGTEYVTDFVIRRHDLRYLVVEIEKPQDRIFNSSDDFTREFSHALGQVLDFQGWVAEHGEYARSSLPNIENPRGLLVIGRRSALTARQESKLRRWSINSNLIDVVTFDDLVTSGRQLLGSLRALIQ